MNEEKWLSLKTNPLSRTVWLASVLAEEPYQRLTRRKRRLHACTMARLLWDRMTTLQRSAVEFAERYADSRLGLVPDSPGSERRRFLLDLDEQRESVIEPNLGTPAGRVALMVAIATANTLRLRHPPPSLGVTTALEAGASEAEVTAAALELFGNPFRPPEPHPAYEAPGVRSMAEDIYQRRAWEEVPLLADQLIELDAPLDGTVVAHFQGRCYLCLGRQALAGTCAGCYLPQAHRVGCWALDFLTQRR